MAGTTDEDYRKDVIDPQILADQKKRLLYDKSLKAYYDPETGQYFEMKRQLIPQSSLGQLHESGKGSSSSAINSTTKTIIN